jgi:two-component system nitrate/nitrite response regulator NarL
VHKQEDEEYRMNPLNPLKVMLVDDHALFVAGIRNLLHRRDDIRVIQTASTGEEALESLKRAQPDVILLDLQMPGMGGLATLEAIAATYPDIKTVMLTASDSDEDLLRAIRHGARGFLLKLLEPGELVDQLRRVDRGEIVVPAAMSARLVEGLAKGEEEAPPSPLEALTDRELGVLNCVAHGLTNKEIGGQLDISENTVKNHVKRILFKLDIENRVQAAALLLQDRGLQDLPGRQTIAALR